jgi:hypothetical protein
VVTLRALHLINLSLRLLIGTYYNIHFTSNPYINCILQVQKVAILSFVRKDTLLPPTNITAIAEIGSRALTFASYYLYTLA